jgi:hypothetical protein
MYRFNFQIGRALDSSWTFFVKLRKLCSSLLPIVLPTLHKKCLKLLVGWGAAPHPYIRGGERSPLM